jgi:ATP-dependent RNA helicase DDX31/DBP7
VFEAMEDDGMLLNFSTTDPTPVYQPKLKGGSWKERLVVKRLTRDRQQQKTHKHGEGATGNRAEAFDLMQSGSDLVQPRPVKRRGESGEFKPASGPAVVTTPAGAPRDHTAPRSQTHPREVISSLFSYNPKPETAPDQSSGPANDVFAQQSNAPLVDGADTFSSLGLSNVIANHLITKLGLKSPTAIQKNSKSHMLQEDLDTFVQAETGSGKTLAYLLPLLQRMSSLSSAKNAVGIEANSDRSVHRDSGIFAIIIAPTRELCKQISVVLERLLGCAHSLVAGTVIGGEKKKSEKARLRKGLNVLVATPGRLADHLENTQCQQCAMAGTGRRGQTDGPRI